MSRTPSTPRSLAPLERWMASWVALLPAPAMTWALLASSRTMPMTLRCSLCVKVADSPVVPHGTRASTPALSCMRTSSRNPSSSISPSSRNGVISAVAQPLNIVSTSEMLLEYQPRPGRFHVVEPTDALDDLVQLRGRGDVDYYHYVLFPGDLVDLRNALELGDPVRNL